MKLVYIVLFALSLLAAAASAGAASLSDTSPYDRNAVCTERSEGPEPDFCTINDGPPPPQYLRRYRQPVVNGPSAVNGQTGNSGSMGSGQRPAQQAPAQPGSRQ
jgi:hypothetical protein